MTPDAVRRRLSALDGTEVEVVILGAGVNGAGLFRDLCLQGVRCLLVDKGDIGSGTSAAPSRLIHGGLKYLETGEFGLVAQSTLERNLLLRNAPHCVAPLPTVIPIFSWSKGVGAALRTFLGSTTAPRSRGALLVKIGLALYDFYGSRHRSMPRHRLVGRAKALREMPGLTSAIVAAGTYHDAWISRPERLVHELVEDGLAAEPEASVATYTRLVSAEGGTLLFETRGGQRVAVRPQIVVNAAGPWIDQVNAALGVPSHLIGGTKGSHILLDHPELVRRLAGRMIYFEADDGRICLVFPYLGRALVGSTDIPADDPDAVRAEDEEIDYLLASLCSLVPGLAFSRDQIAYAYSGIRPLPSSKASVPGLISRDHSAPVTEAEPGRPFPIVSLVGGKWTTFRGFAEEVADSLLGRLGRARRISTREVAIGGGRDLPQGAEARARWAAEVAQATGLGPGRIQELLARYGTTARAVAGHRGDWSDADRLPDATSYSMSEIDWIVRNETVVHLADIVLRRTSLAIAEGLTRRDLEAVATVATNTLGWSEDRRIEELTAASAHLLQVNRAKL
ncbi:glycerol-3-phosphate dehydrogenase/oxidase [Rubellimicrobium roseum]|uniref:Glycerol-3-phosphate dehydrogenase/oxidase n=1 Tax=Rubellimicrobium roseum TaxID=687525 RepID=A0A5C4N7K5_9RHOB|nr:glycerol-3-phosphate dehydrogenase/oxidase [Rubellimicrobium roseum]TNC63484.1 glycerol-3-phosphate dehydrogenase/oxidase [Rubellimicrobium roseum]